MLKDEDILKVTKAWICNLQIHAFYLPIYLFTFIIHP